MTKGLDYSTIQLSIIKFSITEFESYNAVLEKFFEKEVVNIDKEYKKYKKLYRNNEVAIHNLTDYLSDKYNEMGRVFPNHFRISFFNQIMSFTVSQLKDICDLHNRKKNTKYSIEDLKGSELEICKKYLINSADVNFNKLNADWSYLHIAYNIRNRCVHHSGKFNTKSKEFKSIQPLVKKGLLEFKLHPKQKVENLEEVIVLINESFNLEVLKVVKNFFHELLINQMQIIVD